MKKAKWAQLTAVERAYQKMIANQISFELGIRTDFSVREQRRRNKFNQLFNHWDKLRKEAAVKSA